MYISRFLRVLPNTRICEAKNATRGFDLLSPFLFVKIKDGVNRSFTPSFCWYAGRDSNPQPSEPESDALSIEPPAHKLSYYSKLWCVCKGFFVK